MKEQLMLQSSVWKPNCMKTKLLYCKEVLFLVYKKLIRSESQAEKIG